MIHSRETRRHAVERLPSNQSQAVAGIGVDVQKADSRIKSDRSGGESCLGFEQGVNIIQHRVRRIYGEAG